MRKHPWWENVSFSYRNFFAAVRAAVTTPAMHFQVLTLFPEMFPGPLAQSIPGKALAAGLWSLDAVQIRNFARDKHQTVDDTPYGGGAGMVMKPEVVDAALRHAKQNAGVGSQVSDSKLIYFTPRGRPLTQRLVKELVTSFSDSDTRHLSPGTFILLCGRYEGVDERVLTAHKALEISVGDYVLSGGEVAAMVLMDAMIRLLPGVMGDDASLHEESFEIGQDGPCLLEYPHYTKPPLWNGLAVPEVLLSGNHARIDAWRKEQAEEATKTRRPDLWDTHKKTLE